MDHSPDFTLQGGIGPDLMKPIILVFGSMFLLIVAIGIVEAYFKAQSYNRVTGSHITMWDAFLLDPKLRDK